MFLARILRDLAYMYHTLAHILIVFFKLLSVVGYEIYKIVRDIFRRC